VKIAASTSPATISGTAWRSIGEPAKDRLADQARRGHAAITTPSVAKSIPCSVK
jgi:hypothetical protein